MSAVLVASITELCAADHRNNPEILAGWLANKTPAGIGLWFANPANTILVADHEGDIAACGAFNTDRMIILNYVLPRHRFEGISTALLRAMETALGPGAASLESTLTAHRFYLGRGWTDSGPPRAHRGMLSYPMRKQL